MSVIKQVGEHMFKKENKEALEIVRSIGAANQLGRYGQELLGIASASGCLPVATYLIEAGKISVDTKLCSGKTPLMSACANGHLEVARYLAKKGARIDEADETGRQPIVCAVESGNLELVKFLVEELGADSKFIEPLTGLSLPMIANREGYPQIEEFFTGSSSFRGDKK